MTDENLFKLRDEVGNFGRNMDSLLQRINASVDQLRQVSLCNNVITVSTFYSAVHFTVSSKQNLEMQGIRSYAGSFIGKIVLPLLVRCV